MPASHSDCKDGSSSVGKHQHPKLQARHLHTTVTVRESEKEKSLKIFPQKKMNLSFFFLTCLSEFF